jgi:hypothetical protein
MQDFPVLHLVRISVSPCNHYNIWQDYSDQFLVFWKKLPVNSLFSAPNTRDRFAIKKIHSQFFINNINMLAPITKRLIAPRFPWVCGVSFFTLAGRDQFGAGLKFNLARRLCAPVLGAGMWVNLL